MKRRRIVFGCTILAAVAVALLIVLPWWQGPSPESEAATYFERLAPGSVEVLECSYAEDPGGSEYDNYLCTLDARRAVPRGSPGAADIPRGRSTYCFHIGRSANPMDRIDHDAWPSADRKPPCV